MENTAIENGTVIQSAVTTAENIQNLTTVEAETVPFISDIKNLVKNNLHIPYILNGELYEIQTQDGENVTVRCCHCPPDRVYRGSVRSTGNFHMHIKRRHPDLLGKLHDMKVNALIERRDRLMRNRKSSYRGYRSDNINKLTQHSRDLQVQTKNDTTHKLKIKSAYQRHQIQHQQQQQQQQKDETNRNWPLTPFVVPIGGESASPSNLYEPINYSIKPHNTMFLNNSLMPMINRNKEEENHLRHLLSVQLPLQTQETSASLTLTEIQSPKECFVRNGNSSHFDLGSGVTPSSSTISSLSNPFSVADNAHYHNISVVKDELLMPIEEAIDLSVNSSSSIALSSGNITNTAPSAAQTSLDRHFAAGSLSPPISKWHDLLQLTLSDIQHEMRTRNQIEKNRLFLDIAKFKYLHPGFNFQC